MQRINWIDWVKALCMTGVIFIHLPQDENTFHLNYIGAVILTPFFFISGYLSKQGLSQKELLKKYSFSLLIPYIIYNVLFYPYWLVKFYIDHGGIITLWDCIKPIVGTILLQLNSNFSSELNAITWFLPALFLMHWITGTCYQLKHGKILMALLAISTILLYGANKYYNYAPNLTFNGFVRSLTFFFAGYLCQKSDLLKNCSLRKDLCIGIISFVVSLAVFYWHIHEDHFVLHISLYYVVSTLALIGIIHLCKSINNLRIHLITLIAVGTIVILGFQNILIGIINFGFEKALHIPDISYNWSECVILAIAIETILIPFVIISKNRFPILLGKKSTVQKIEPIAA